MTLARIETAEADETRSGSARRVRAGLAPKMTQPQALRRHAWLYHSHTISTWKLLHKVAQELEEG